MKFLKLINSSKGSWYRIDKCLISTLPKATEFTIDPIIDDELKKSKNKSYGMTSFKKHFGRNTLYDIKFPKDLEKSIENVLSDFPATNMKEDAKKLKLFIYDRRMPVEKDVIWETKQKIIDDFKYDDRIFDQDFIDTKVEQEVEFKLKRKLRHWEKIQFNKRMGLLYLMSRFEPEYSVVYQILSEIKKKDPHFCPERVFDFGSGLGTVMWAANTVWDGEIKEMINCDASKEMNSLAELITKGGNIDKPAKFKNVFYRSNLAKENDFSLVTSCFSMFEMSNRKERFELLESLWSKVKDDGYLVLTELGSKHGFTLIAEARKFFLTELMGNDKDSTNEADTKLRIFAPCPHAKACPMLNEKKSCIFSSTYWPLNTTQNSNLYNKQATKYSYLVIKKTDKQPEFSEWPRLVLRNPQKHGKVTDSWLCNRHGEVDHLVSTSSRCIKTSRLVKYSHLGDNLPLDYRRAPKEDV